MLKSNHRIRVDHVTGEYFELNKLAPKTYYKIKEETEVIRKQIVKAFGRFVPPEKEVRLVYEGEDADAEKKAVKDDDKRMPVEMEKKRPEFFSQNLMQKARTPSNASSTTTVRPSGLG